MRVLVLLFFVLLPAQIFAQQIGVEASIWSTSEGGGGSSVSIPSATIRLGLPFSEARSVLQTGVSYAAERDNSPGLLLLEAEVTRRLIGSTKEEADLFVSAGFGALRFAADRQQALIDACAPACFFEGDVYRSGWRPEASAGVGADLPITEGLWMQPTVRLVRLMGSSDAGPRGRRVVFRFSVGLTWQR